MSRGCNVVFADISLRPEAKDLIARYEGKDKSPRAFFVQTDVTSWVALTKMFDSTVAEFGSFDVVCPGAGVYEPHWSSFWVPPGSALSKDALDADHYAQLDINLVHPIRATQIALSHWLYPRTPESGAAAPEKASPSNPKRVIHVSSVAGHVPVWRAPIYGAAKFGVSGFVRSLAKLEPIAGVRVAAVAPGLVRTPLWTEHPEKLQNVDEDKDGWITPLQVAEAMLSCVEGDEHIGGTILEIGKDHVRQVTLANDPGPDVRPGRGIIASNGAAGDLEVMDFLGDSSIWGI